MIKTHTRGKRGVFFFIKHYKAKCKFGGSLFSSKQTYKHYSHNDDERNEKGRKKNYLVCLVKRVIKVWIHCQTQFDGPISCQGKPMEQTTEIMYPLIPLVHFSSFP